MLRKLLLLRSVRGFRRDAYNQRSPISPSWHKAFSSSSRTCHPHSHHSTTTTASLRGSGSHDFLVSFLHPCSWQSQLSRVYLRPLGILARTTLPSSLGKMLITRVAHFPVSLRTLSERGLRWSIFSLQKRAFDSPSFGTRRRFWRSWIPTSDGVVYGLIGVNVAVYVLWRTEDFTFMRQNFTISIDNVKSGRLHTLITSAFSHMDGDHILTNMIGLYFFGTSIGRLFGSEFLLKLYMAGAISGSIFFLVHNALIVPALKGIRMRDHSRTFALGASAAVNAILLLDVFLFPKNIYYLNFFIPVPAALMGAILIGSDLWRIKMGDDRVSGSAHLGGAVVAALVWARIRRRWI